LTLGDGPAFGGSDDKEFFPISVWYAGGKARAPMLEKVTDWASKTFDRTRAPAAPQAVGDALRPAARMVHRRREPLPRLPAHGQLEVQDFADVWQYPAYWNKFADTAAPTDAWGVHAYSHVNTFSSAAMAYAVTGDPLHIATVHLAPGTHNYNIMKEYEESGEDMPMAIWVGHHPAVIMGMNFRTAYRQSHYETAGAFSGQPLSVGKWQRENHCTLWRNVSRTHLLCPCYQWSADPGAPGDC
jgi:hypothetical protein